MQLLVLFSKICAETTDLNMFKRLPITLSTSLSSHGVERLVCVVIKEETLERNQRKIDLYVHPDTNVRSELRYKTRMRWVS